MIYSSYCCRVYSGKAIHSPRFYGTEQLDPIAIYLFVSLTSSLTVCSGAFNLNFETG
jgi:hypothetical protein